MTAPFRTLRALALAFVLPGLLLSGALHLCVCLGELLDLGTACPDVQSTCCALPEQEPSLAESTDCSDCCIEIDVAGAVLLASPPQTDFGLDAIPIAPAPAHLSLGPVAEATCARPAREAPRLQRPPGRAPTPLRI